MSRRKRAPETFSFHPFEKLREIIDHKKISAAVKTPDKKIKPPTDEELFASAMKEVREIAEFRQIPVDPIKPVSVCIHKPRRSELKVLEEVIRGRIPINLPDTQEYVQWVNAAHWPASDCSIAEKLHSGAFSVQDCLDLHGLIADEAEAATDRFLKEALARGLCCVKIIHGRGLRSPDGPVLKTALIRWLTGHHKKNVIAFASARQCDGGLGALYILLKD